MPFAAGKGVDNADKNLKPGMQWTVLKVTAKDPIPLQNGQLIMQF